MKYKNSIPEKDVILDNRETVQYLDNLILEEGLQEALHNWKKVIK